MRVLTVTTVFTGLAWLIYITLGAWLLIFGCAFLAVSINPAVDWLSRFMPWENRGLAIATVMIAGLAVVTLLVVSFVPPLVKQTVALADQTPQLVSQLTSGSGAVAKFVQKYNLVDQVKAGQNQIIGSVTSFSGQAIGILGNIFFGFTVLLFGLGLVFFMSLEGPNWYAIVFKSIPKRHVTHARKLVDQMYRAITGYVVGSLVASLIITAITAGLLFAVGVPYALPLGILVGLLDLVPLVGTVIGAVIVVAVSWFTSVAAAVVMAIFFLIYMQLEGQILKPLIYGRTVKVSPLVVLLAILIGVQLAGVFGALVAIPVAASVQILVRDYFERRWALLS
jgi:predicted PurR-regulated permease PerM